MYKELLEYIVKRLVQYPEKVEVIQVENEVSQSNLQKLKVKVLLEN